jgi:hypothetical protein
VVTLGGSGKASAGGRMATGKGAATEGGELRVKISVNSPPAASTSPTRSTASRRPLSARPFNGSRTGRCVCIYVCVRGRVVMPIVACHRSNPRGLESRSRSAPSPCECAPCEVVCFLIISPSGMSHTAPSEPTTYFHQGGDIWVSRAVSCAMAWLTTVGGGGGGSVYGGEEKGRASRVGSIVLQPHKRQQTDRVARCVAPRPTSVRPTPSTKESGH